MYYIVHLNFRAVEPLQFVQIYVLLKTPFCNLRACHIHESTFCLLSRNIPQRKNHACYLVLVMTTLVIEDRQLLLFPTPRYRLQDWCCYSFVQVFPHLLTLSRAWDQTRDLFKNPLPKWVNKSGFVSITAKTTLSLTVYKRWIKELKFVQCLPLHPASQLRWWLRIRYILSALTLFTQQCFFPV